MAQAYFWCRDLINTPCEDLGPQHLVRGSEVDLHALCILLCLHVWPYMHLLRLYLVCTCVCACMLLLSCEPSPGIAAMINLLLTTLR